MASRNHRDIGDPKLGALANNGGPTQTMALLPGSPAIDAGSNSLALGPDGKPLLTDQRGYARIVNGIVDIGAYESGSSIPGDANADGVVDFKDLVILASHYGQQTGATFAQGDFNGDGKVDFTDLVILAQNYGRSTAAAVNGSPTTAGLSAAVNVMDVSLTLKVLRRLRRG